MTALTPLTDDQQQKALELVAAWMGAKYFDGPPCPTGYAASTHALGPVLIPDYEGVWVPITPTPTILVEGIPGADWAYWACSELVNEFAKIGVWSEPLTGFALALYPTK